MWRPALGYYPCKWIVFLPLNEGRCAGDDDDDDDNGNWDTKIVSGTLEKHIITH